MTTILPFAHRRNPDASVDSICTACFQTIATEKREDNLIAYEESHSCDPYWELTRDRFDSRQRTSAQASHAALCQRRRTAA